ncbi:MAG: EcsC family protein [Pseudomonadota bacterium]
MVATKIVTATVNDALHPDDFNELKQARILLENPGLVARISNLAGRPIEKSIELLPGAVGEVVQNGTRRAVEKALDIAVGTLNTGQASPAANRLHQLVATASGGVGGAFGLAALSLELPISTTIMLRSIADIARSEGEDLAHPEARLHCLQVLALGGRSGRDDGSETAYFAARAALARTVSEAAAHIARKGLAEKSAPAIVRLISLIASRFSIVVSEKAAAQAVPVIGALGGAALNAIFIGHFQDMAYGHFVVRRLERIYGAEVVRRTYEAISIEREPKVSGSIN